MSSVADVTHVEVRLISGDCVEILTKSDVEGTRKMKRDIVKLTISS